MKQRYNSFQPKWNYQHLAKLRFTHISISIQKSWTVVSISLTFCVINFCLTQFYIFVEELTNALRGHPVNGRRFKTPDGVLGVVYEENKTKLSETNRTLKVHSVFNEYVYWNYDKIPSDNDAIIKALDWIEISKSVRISIASNLLVEYLLAVTSVTLK